MADTKAIFSKMEENVKANPELSESINAVFQFDLEGDGGGTWTLDLKKNPGEISEGAADSPDCTIQMTVEDFGSMVDKTANPMQLYMSQKLKVLGNLPLSLKLQEILK